MEIFGDLWYNLGNNIARGDKRDEYRVIIIKSKERKERKKEKNGSLKNGEFR